MEELIVYVINTNRLFMTGGESVGRSYTPQEFELEFNSGRINAATDIIRFIRRKSKKEKAHENKK